MQRDITHLKEFDRLKDQFVSNVSHELRTPLTNIKLYLQLLDRGKPEKRSEYMQTLYRENRRLENLIEDLLQISRLDMDKSALTLTPTDLNQLAAQLASDRTNLAAERGLELSYQLDPQLPLAQTNATLITEVISNLLGNAMNYTPSGGRVQIITQRRSAETDQPGGLLADWATVTVQDNGPGISATDLAHLFERFYRGEAGRKSGAPGTGLGLAICKNIVEKMGGHITVESRPGQGAAFTVWLQASS